MDIEQASIDIVDEYQYAATKFSAFNNGHEGWAVIKEEMDELWEEVKANKGDAEARRMRMRAEARQIAAMGLRFMVDLT